MTLTPEQHAARKIGGSDAPLIMEGERYGKTLYDLWEEKTGRRESEDLSGVLHVQMGVFTEPFNRGWFTKQTGLEVATPPETFVHPEHTFMTAHPDGMIGEDVWEAKHIGAFNKTDPREAYYAQLQHNMAVMGSRKAHLSVFKGTDNWAAYEVERDDQYIAELISREAEFWFCVEADVEPAGFESVAAPVIEAVREVDMTGSNEWADLAARWLCTKDAARDFEDAKKGLKKLIEADVSRAHGYGIEAIRDKRGVTIKEMSE